MPKILLTYWWNGHEPGDTVETDDQTARELVGVIARPVEDTPEAVAKPKQKPKPETESESESESGDERAVHQLP